MGATPSVQRDAKSPEDAPEDIGAELSDTQDGENVDGKPLQKNGQISISSLNGKTDDQTEFNGHTEENPPAEVGQTETITQTEDIPETTEVHQEEVAPQVNGEKEDNSANADEITSTEEKAEEEKQEEVNEVGFKKIFRFVGFKFTLKKDKNEKTEPVQLLTVKEAESGADTSSEDKKEEPAIEEDKSVEDKSPETTEKEQDKSPETTENDQEATPEEVTDKAEETADKTAVEAPSDTEKLSEEVTEKSAEEIGTEKEPEKEPEPEAPTESPTSPPSQETQSPFKKFFTQGIFSNLRKKASFKKPKDEEPVKEKSAEEDIKETEETADGVVEGTEEPKVDAEKEQAEGEQIEKLSEKVETKPEITTETTSTEPEEPQELKVEAEATSEAETLTQTETAEAPAAEIAVEVQPTDDSKPSDKPDVSEAATTEAEILSSQEKPKAQGSPLKKLFTGAGLKKLSSKKQKSKKEAESKQTESSEQVAENIQSSTESAEPQKPDSGASSPEESGEHLVGEVPQAEVAHAEVAQAEVAQAAETEGEPVPSDSEKKKDGILPWSSFKKLVTPKKRVKRPSESEDEAPGDKPKSSTLSSTESAVFDEKVDEPKPPEELSPESKEESQAESKAEPKVEKPEPTAEEPKRKMDTSVSWEALICVGSAKKRARKTSDSDDEEPKIEEELQESGEEQTKTAESPLVSSGEADHENLASSPEPEEELVSTWESFKRLVTHRKKPKAEDKSDEASGPEHTTSDSEAPKEESSFSLRKLIPRRKKKSDGKQEQISSDIGSAEDDSDTPAVVPLSEYDNEPPAEVAVTGEEVKQESAPVTQAKTLAEDRSPSWISTTVENVEDETEGKQLSDIPEEGDTAATPKSADNTIAEDIVELTSEAVTALEQVEETEMVSAVSRVTASPVTSGETTPVPGDGVENKTDVVLQEVVETISVTTSAMAVTMTKEQEEVIAVSTDVLLVESAIKEEKTVLVAHEKTEATTVCVGLDTSEIKAVEEESLTQKPSVESVTVVSQVLVTELAVEDKTQEPEQASMTEDEVHEAQMSGGQTELKENVVKEKAQFEEIKETSEAEAVTDLQEVAAVKVALINAVQQEPEFLEEPVVAEKSPQVEAAGPVEPTVEESPCAQTVEVTEVAVAEGEKVQELEDVKEAKATVEVVSVEGVAMAVTEEVMATLPEVPASQTAGSTEDSIPVVATTEEFAVIKETVCITNSTSETTESHSAALACETVMEKVPLVLPTDDQKIQVKVNDAEVGSAQEVIEKSLEVTSTKVSVLVEEVIENMKEETEVIQATQVTEAEIIEKQSSVIVQEVIQNVVENIAGAHAEQKVSAEKEENCTTSVDVKFEEAPVVSGMGEEKTSTEVVLEEKTQLETSPEKPKASDDICKDDDEQTRIVTEKPMKTVNDTILITETVTVSITDEIQPQNEEVATVSVEDVHHETEVTKSEVELKQAEEKKHSGTTESEEGKSQVESHPKDVEASEVSEAIPEEKMTETSAVGESQDQIVAEQYQMAQEVQIETVQEFNVGVINVINADDVPVQDTETNMKEESSEGKESVEDKLQKDLEESQTEVSIQDTTNQEESRDPDCQKTDAKNVPAKLETATDKSVNAVAVEEVMEEIGNEIEQVSSEVVTVS